MLAAFDLSSDAILILDHEDCVRYANESAAVLLEIEPTTDIRGTSFHTFDLGEPGSVDSGHCAENSQFQSGIRCWKTSSGRVREMACRFSASGTALNRETIVVANDVQPATPDGFDIGPTRDQLNRVFNDSGVGMVLLTPDGQIVQVNKAFADMLGYKFDELNGHQLRRFIHPGDVDFLQETLEQWKPGSRFVAKIEIRYLDGSERPVWTQVTFSTIASADGKLPIAVAQVQDITDQQLTVEALRLSQARFQDFASAASDWMWEMGPELRFSYFSRRLTELTGTSSLKLLGRTVEQTEIGENANPEEFEKLLNNLAERKPFRNFVYRRVRDDKSEVWLSVSGKPIFDDTDQFLGYRGTGTDITERIEAEEALRRSEETMRRSVIDAPIPAMIHAEDGVIQAISAVWAEISGYGQDELPTIMDWIETAYPPGFREPIVQGLKSLYSIETRVATGIRPIRTKQGQIRYWDFQSSPLGRLSDGRRYVITMAVDVTDRMAAQEQLRVLSRATDQSMSGIAITDRDGIIQYVNRKYTEMTGYLPDETIGRDLNQLFMESDEGGFLQIQKELSRTGSWEGSVLNTRKSGEKYWESVSIFGIRDEAETTTHLAVIKEDITEKKRTEFELQNAIERAEIANRAKSDFLANMSHELRTPLNAIIGFSEAIGNELFGRLNNDRYEGYIDDIRISALHLLGIINDILDLSKIEAGMMQLDRVPINLHTIASECVELVQTDLSAADISLNLNFQDDLPLILGDPRSFRQIFLNLLSNAIKFTPADGWIAISGTLREDGDLEFTVRDNGIGISERDINRVLQPFSQANSSLAKSSEGTGLGLSISKSLVEHHDGTLLIESGQNLGTSIIIKIPRTRLVS